MARLESRDSLFLDLDQLTPDGAASMAEYYLQRFNKVIISWPQMFSRDKSRRSFKKLFQIPLDYMKLKEFRANPKRTDRSLWIGRSTYGWKKKLKIIRKATYVDNILL